MNAEELYGLTQAALARYLWDRLRLEAPLNPPLDTRWRDEPPEAFVIESLRSYPDADFRARVSNAIRENLRRLALENSQGKFDTRSTAQLASLAFLSVELRDEAIAHALYAFALNWHHRALNIPGVWGQRPQPMMTRGKPLRRRLSDARH